jgi:protein gp37
MVANSKIQWTDHTFNPWWGCVNVSPGCDNCYAEAFAKRVGQDVWGKDGERRFFKDKHWNEPLKWAPGSKVFCASMADVFELNHSLDAERERLWDLIEATPHLTWQLLTKRPENLDRLGPHHFPSNVWWGTTVEDAARAALRVPRLNYRAPRGIRFLSCEPLIEDVAPALATTGVLGGIDWLIVGCESGPRSRPFDIEWARILRDLCAANDIAFFVKQLPDPKRRGAVFHDLDDFPEDLRIREFPQAIGVLHGKDLREQGE